MSDVTRILSAIEQGDQQASEDLLPLVYEELRQLASARLSKEKPGQTLQATALVHEAYVRLVNVEEPQKWSSRKHFFSAAAEAMRRILVERARRMARVKHGGEYRRQAEMRDDEIADNRTVELLRVDAALDELAEQDALAADLVKLRFFGGMTVQEVAAALDISTRTADRHWVYAKAWLRQALGR